MSSPGEPELGEVTTYKSNWLCDHPWKRCMTSAHL